LKDIWHNKISCR